MSESTPEPSTPQPVGELDDTYGSGSAAAGPDQDVPTDTILEPPAGQAP